MNTSEVFSSLLKVVVLSTLTALACTPRVEQKEPPKAGDKSPNRSPAAPALAHADVSQRGQTIEGLGMFGPEKVWWEQGPYFDESYLDFVVTQVGASIFRTQIYWDAEPTNDNDDAHATNLGAFHFGPESLNGRQFPWLSALSKRSGVKVIASVWTPPTWMKLDADNQLASFCHGQCGGRLNPELREEFAEYLAVYVKVVKAQTGLELYALSIANEPIFANAFESCVYSVEEYAETLEVVAKRFKQERLTTRLFGPEHMGNAAWNRSLGFQPALLEKKSRANMLHAFAVHGYLDGVNADTGTAAGWETFRREANSAGLELWMTETSDKDDATYSGALKQAQGLHYALKDGQVSAWVFWYLGPPHIKREASGFAGTPLVDLLRHYYSFIRPGAVQIALEKSDSAVLSLAFLSVDEGVSQVNVVSLNQSNEPQPAPLVTNDHPGWRVVRAAQTTKTSGYQEKSDGSDFGQRLPGHSITSWRLQH